jgi:hypothetical protein
MTRKRLSDLIQEETQKPSPTPGDSVIDVAATTVTSTALETQEAMEENQEKAGIDAKKETPTLENKVSETTQKAVNSELELKVKDLEAKLVQAQKHQESVQDLQKNLEKHQEEEASQKQQIIDLQGSLFEQKTLAERLGKELYEAKKAALHLAEANSKLMEEVNTMKQLKGQEQKRQIEQEQEKQIEKEKEKEKEKESQKLVTYKKSSLKGMERMPIARNEESADSSSPMWLLD